MADTVELMADWQDTEGEMPSLRIVVRESVWALWRGAHPRLYSGTAANAIDPFKDRKKPNLSPEFQPAPVGHVCGHDVVNDWAMGSPIGYNRVPISPTFIRDLAGRLLYAGGRPVLSDEKKGVPGMLPAHVRDAQAMVGAELVEEVFFVEWRRLAASAEYEQLTSGSPENVSAIYYDKHNLYPYKLRLDTFYVDGWRVPQTNYLYVKQNTNLQEAEDKAAALLRLWNGRPQGEEYANFIERLGEDFVDQAYDAGCTLIPTFEACNGYNKVSENFELVDYWPGRAVPEFHKVIETRASDAPQGTILEVTQPGFALANRVEPAHVIVSDGTGYKTPHADAPEPLVPDLRLPHQRTAPKWGATWLPTHPAHFEAPAIWGWHDKSGHFMQASGPLWDPLHYYYACTPAILEAELNGRLKQNQALVKVPDSMRRKFYPIVEMRGFDTFSYTYLVQCVAENREPITLIKHHDNGKPSCNVGYHPMPLFYEHELDNWWFPELMPKRLLGDGLLPFSYEGRLAAVIKPQVGIPEYKNTLVGTNDNPWLTDEALLGVVSESPLENYPQLKRYNVGEVAEIDMGAIPDYLEYIPDSILNITVADFWSQYDSYEDIEAIAPGLYAELQEFRDKSLKLMRLRHRIFRQNRNMYLRAYWEGTLPKELENQFFEADSGTQTQKPKLKAAFAAPPVITNE